MVDLLQNRRRQIFNLQVKMQASPDSLRELSASQANFQVTNAPNTFGGRAPPERVGGAQSLPLATEPQWRPGREHSPAAVIEFYGEEGDGSMWKVRR